MKTFHQIGLCCWIIYTMFILNMDLSNSKTAAYMFLGAAACFVIRILGDKIIQHISNKKSGHL